VNSLPTSPAPASPSNAPLRLHADVVVVGARLAGAATAMLLARRGLRVVVLERGTYGSDTLSTHAFMKTGVIQLQRWGLLDRVVASGVPALRRTTIHYGPDAVTIPVVRRGAMDGAGGRGGARSGGEGSASDEPHASGGQDGRSEPSARLSSLRWRPSRRSRVRRSGGR
jgi:choline dehydrogenase-like flavoprotein